MILLFAVIAVSTAVNSGWSLYRHLTEEFKSKGVAIASSIAGSSVEILLNRDASTVQAMIDQYLQIKGVAYVFVKNDEGEIVSHTFVPAIPEEVKTIKEKKEETSVTLTRIPGFGPVMDISTPILAGIVGHVHVGMNRGLILSSFWSAIVNQELIVLIIFALTILLAYLAVNRVSQPLNTLAQYARELASHDFSSDESFHSSVNLQTIKSDDEVGKLAETFEVMEGALYQSIRKLKETTAARERIESQLEIAREIQLGILPRVFPPFPERKEMEIFATLSPAQEVGGDFYDFFFIDNDRLLFAVGDVSDKGVPAALFMAVTKTFLKACASGSNGDNVLFTVNNELCRENESCMFVTLFCGILNTLTGEVKYSNAGHNPPYVLRSSGEVERLQERHGMALGAVENTPFGASRLFLRPGDCLFLYTDGVTEAMDTDKQLFTEKRLKECLASQCGSSPEKAIQRVVREIMNHVSGAQQSDDLTMLCVRYAGTNSLTHNISLRIKNNLMELERVSAALDHFRNQHGLSREVLFAVNLSIEEMITNIVSYGYDDSAEHEILIACILEDNQLTIRIEDDGKPFNPTAVPEPDLESSLMDRKVGGLGVHLAKKMMDKVEYRREENRNILEMGKHLS